MPDNPIPWPPDDASELIARWIELGRPEIPVDSGSTITDLERWFDPQLYPLPNLAKLLAIIHDALF